MSLPQHVVYNQGGTISCDVLTRPTTGATVTVIDGNGTTKASAQTATLSTVNSTISSAAAKGALSVVVVSATGIASNVEFWLASPPEKVRCKSISSLTVTLWQPLLYAHASGVKAEGTQLTYAVTAAQANAIWWDGRAQWVIDSAAAVSLFTSVECTKYPLARNATVQDLYAEHPKLFQIMDVETDLERLLDLAHEDVLTRIGAKARCRVFAGSTQYNRAVVYLAISNIYRRQASDDGTRLFERYRAEAEAEIERIVAIVPRDSDQDAAIEASDQMSYRNLKLVR